MTNSVRQLAMIKPLLLALLVASVKSHSILKPADSNVSEATNNTRLYLVQTDTSSPGPRLVTAIPRLPPPPQVVSPGHDGREDDHSPPDQPQVSPPDQARSTNYSLFQVNPLLLAPAPPRPRYITAHPPQVQSDPQRHACLRECVEGQPPMTCRYRFEVEWYHTLSKACYNCPLNGTDCERPHCILGDGVRRPVLVVNRQLPGPGVEVCQGDQIVVDVVNELSEESTSIHWHGHHQRGTPYMDGVPFVTQCPVAPHTTFRYRYHAATPGTHFWHSHSGSQRADGAFGSLIVRVPKSRDPHCDLYDHDLPEHTVQILDWGHELGIVKFLEHHHAGGNNKPQTILVNGRGRLNNTDQLTDDSYSPLAKFTVERGFRYRFRLINAGFLNCPIQLSVDNHTLLVIASDGSNLEPVEADSLVSYAGERFDFVINADEEIANYWLRFRGLMDCDERFTSAHQVAVLHYQGADDKEPKAAVSYEASRRKGLTVNELNVALHDASLLMPELSSLDIDDDISLKTTADITHYISYDFYPLDNPMLHRAPLYGFYQVSNKSCRVYTPQFNHISMKLPSSPPLSQPDDIDSSAFCNEDTVGNCTGRFCHCTHLLRIPLGAVVELVLVDKGVTYDANHPFHLHGNAFRVVAMDRLGKSTTVEAVKELDRAGGIKRKLHNAPVKDTVNVPDGGYTIIRFHANNPGFWLFHCHIEFHVEVGMALILQVGERADLPPIPHGFPQCGNYIPNVDDDDDDDETEIEVVQLGNVVGNDVRENEPIPTLPVLSELMSVDTNVITRNRSSNMTLRLELLAFVCFIFLLLRL